MATVERKVEIFTPVVITLETQKEVDAIFALVGASCPSDIGTDLTGLYSQLKEFKRDDINLIIRKV